MRSLSVLISCVFCSQPFPLRFLHPQTSDGQTFFIRVYVPSLDDYFEHNMWNPLLELLFLEHVNGIVDSYLVDVDLAKIALSYHFALDLLCLKEEVFFFTR